MAAAFEYTTDAKGVVTISVDGSSRSFPTRDAALAWLVEVEQELLAEEAREFDAAQGEAQ